MVCGIDRTLSKLLKTLSKPTVNGDKSLQICSLIVIVTSFKLSKVIKKEPENSAFLLGDSRWCVLLCPKFSAEEGLCVIVPPIVYCDSTSLYTYILVKDSIPPRIYSSLIGVSYLLLIFITVIYRVFHICSKVEFF